MESGQSAGPQHISNILLVWLLTIYAALILPLSEELPVPASAASVLPAGIHRISLPDAGRTILPLSSAGTFASII